MGFRVAINTKELLVNRDKIFFVDKGNYRLHLYHYRLDYHEETTLSDFEKDIILLFERNVYQYTNLSILYDYVGNSYNYDGNLTALLYRDEDIIIGFIESDFYEDDIVNMFSWCIKFNIRDFELCDDLYIEEKIKRIFKSI